MSLCNLRPEHVDLLGFDYGDARPPAAKILKPEPAAIPAVTTLAELSALVGVPIGRGRVLGDRGVFVKAGRNRFDTRSSLQAFSADLQQQAKRGSVGSELDREKVRVQRETADKLAAHNAVQRGELVAAADVEKAWTAVLRDVRAALLAVPSRVGARVPALSAHDIGEITREIHDALADLAGKGLQAGQQAGLKLHGD